jgi:hypothetical protein
MSLPHVNDVTWRLLRRYVDSRIKVGKKGSEYIKNIAAKAEADKCTLTPFFTPYF